MAKRIYTFLLLSLMGCIGAQAGLIQQYQATLFGSGGVVSPGGVIGNTTSAGFAFLQADFDVDLGVLTVEASTNYFLQGNATAFLITDPFTGSNTGPTLFTLSGVTFANSGSLPTQSFNLNSTQASQLQGGSFYALLQTDQHPLGDIGGSLVMTGTRVKASEAPEPTSLLLSGVGLGLLLLASKHTRILAVARSQSN